METLTTRELQVADLIHQGYIEKEIADRLFLSPGTVHTYKKRLFQKLGARNIADITRIYILDIKHPGMVVSMLFGLVLQFAAMIADDLDLRRSVRARARVASVRTFARCRTSRTFKFKLS